MGIIEGPGILQSKTLPFLTYYFFKPDNYYFQSQFRIVPPPTLLKPVLIHSYIITIKFSSQRQ